MSSRTRAIFLFLTIVAVMLVSAVGTTSVYADDGTPPPPPAETEVVDQPTGEPVEVAATAEPVEPVATAEPTEVVPVEEAPVVEEQAPVEEAATILEQIPDNMEVTVLNAEGEAQPLTTQESAEAIVASDPIWCPGTQAPTPGANGCTTSFGSFDELLTYLADPTNAVTGAGTIYVEMGDYAGPETSINFDNYTLTNISNSNLTIQGGWDTVGGTTTSTSNFNVPIVIGAANPWTGSLTINNIVIDGVANQTGLTLVSSNNITLTNVTVTNSQGGADLKATKRVRITDSNFNNNKKFGAKIQAGTLADLINSNFNNNQDEKSTEDGYGLKIDSLRAALEGVNANNNEAFGANINSPDEVYIVDSVFSGNVGYTSECEWVYAKENKTSCHQVCVKIATGNGYGLNAVSTGAAYLENVAAENNYLFGAHLEGSSVEVAGGKFNHNGSFNDPAYDPDAQNSQAPGKGLEIVSTDTVTLANVEANNNQVFGANVQAVNKVKISNSFFDGNVGYTNNCVYITARDTNASCHWQCTKVYQGYGLQAVSTAANVDLDTVSASNNYLFGAHLEGATSVNISNSTFSNNASDERTGRGLEVKSGGDVNLNQVTANNNQAFGANIQSVGNINIVLSTFSGHQIYEDVCTYQAKDNKPSCGTKVCVKTLVGGGYGLEAITTGATSQINISGVTANDNYLFGMHLVTAYVNIAGNNGENHAERNKEGVKIEATGAVAIDSLIANENQLFGATITSGTNEAFVGKVQISNSFFSGNASYTASTCKGKTYYGYGLRVVTTGDDITLTNVVADDNNLYGAYLEGASISVSGVGGSSSTFSNNGTGNPADHIGKGLEIVSTGELSTVSLNNVKANGNQLFGADVKAQGDVSVFQSTFSGNQSYTTTCTKSTGSSGGKPSVGSGGTKPSCSGGGQTCTKTYDGYGIKIVTTGNIYMEQVTAEDNYLFGAHLEGKDVSVYDSEFNHNVSPVVQGQTPTGRGLEVVSTRDTLLGGVKASNNQLFGADIQAGGIADITDSIFADNKYSVSCSTKGYGLKVVAKTSPISLTSVSATGNGAEGTILNGQGAINVTDSLFNNNGASGLDITAQGGDVTLTNVEASQNKGDGVSVKGACTNSVVVTGGLFEKNSKYGIKVVDATYAPNATTPPSFNSNGSGDFFQSDCNSGGGTGGGNTGGGNTGGGNTGGGNTGGGWNGWNWWNWWVFWYHYGHH